MISQQSDDDDLQLSAETLSMLREFARDNGIVIDEGESGQQCRLKVQEHFQPKKSDSDYNFQFPSDKRDNCVPIYINLHGIRRDLGQTLNSTGLTIWLGSEILSNYLYDAPQLVENKRIIELGSGLGLVCILLSKMSTIMTVPPQRIVATDGDVDTVRLLQENLDKNRIADDGEVQVHPLLWWTSSNQLTDPTLLSLLGQFDLIVAADVSFEVEPLFALFSTARDLMTLTGEFILSHVHRNVDIDIVIRTAANAGLVADLKNENIIHFRRHQVEGK